MTEEMKNSSGGAQRAYARGTSPHASLGGTLRSVSSFAKVVDSEAQKEDTLNPCRKGYIRSHLLAEEGKKIAIIIPFRSFRDEEYFIPKSIFQQAGIRVSTVSNSKGIAIGDEGGEAKVDLLAEELKPEEYDAILFIGGPGALKYLDDAIMHRIAQETLAKGKILGAICVAPAILANAGVLKGINATVWSSSMDKSAVKILKGNGAKYIDKPVVVDGNVITANGPLAASKFAETVTNNL